MNSAIYISLLLFGSTLAVPLLYKDRQDGQLNARIGLDDISFLIIPPTKLLDDVVQAFGRQSATAQVTPAEGQSKQLDPQNSPYTVELSSTNAEETKPNEEIIRIPDVNKKSEDENKKKEQEPIKKVVEDPKKVVEKKKVDEGVKKVVEESKKKVEKTVDETKKKVADGVKKTVEDTKTKVDDGKKKMKMEEEEEVLSLIQSGIEECGPDGKRNPQGICVYTPIKT